MQAVLEAISDPTRRRVIELLRTEERSAGELAAEFCISRPAVSRHLRVLREAGLVRTRAEAQRQIYELDATPLAELDAWLSHYRSFWPGRLNALGESLTRRTL